VPSNIHSDNSSKAGHLAALVAVLALFPGFALAGDLQNPQPTRLVNFSARANVGGGQNGLIAGFAISGDSSTQKNILVRGIGPSLSLFGLQPVLADPVLTFNVITGSNPEYQATNTGWATQPVVLAPVDNIWMLGWGAVEFHAATQEIMSGVGAFLPIAPTSADTALLATLPSGTFTGGISSTSGGTGIALAEIYDADHATGNGADTARLVNFSARAMVGNGPDVLIAGFVITGSVPDTVLVRAIGPSLVSFGIDHALASPTLTVYDSTGLVIATDTGWTNEPVNGDSPVYSWVYQASSDEFSLAGAFQLISSNSADSALLVTLPAGAYTVEVSGSGNAKGVALVEIYETSPPLYSVAARDGVGKPLTESAAIPTEVQNRDILRGFPSRLARDQSSIDAVRSISHGEMR
jgi:hypothetical protein